MSGQAHLFSFFFPGLSQIRTSRQVKIDDPEIVYRLFGVVRKRAGDKIVLFDDQSHAQAKLIECSKKVATISIEKVESNKPINPELLVCVGLTKKAYFEEVLYVCSALGVQTVLPILSSQVERNWLTEKDFARLDRISVTAREQAKSFAPTQILKPVKLPQLSSQLDRLDFYGPKVLFQKSERSFFDLVKDLNREKPEKITLIFGPEGGLLEVERETLISDLGFQPCGLCPTTLRTEDAVTVAVGAIRSLV